MTIKKHLEFLAVLVSFMGGIISAPLTCLLFAYVICFTHFYWLPLGYMFYVIIDRGVLSRGGRPSMWVRRWAWWGYFRDYFPVKLVKTAELDPANNYLLCAYPHGFIPVGMYTNFATEATNISSVFPGISPYLITLRQFLCIPLFRELILRQGMCSSSRDSINYLLDKSRGTGKAVVLVAGGTAEILKSSPGSYHIILSRRKGFVRLALQHGASLVPVFSFGETEAFQGATDLKGTWAYRFLMSFDKYAFLSPSFFLSWMLYFYCYGILPRRVSITTVVGKPIPVYRTSEPTEEQVDVLHKKFQQELQKLFEVHKTHYVKDPLNTVLHIE